MINICCHALYKIVSVPKYGEKSTLNRKEFYGNKFIVESYICVYIYTSAKKLRIEKFKRS